MALNAQHKMFCARNENVLSLGSKKLAPASYPGEITGVIAAGIRSTAGFV
jgi:hypothetical protein